ncbi:MAG: hypothetical protein VSS75_027175 [Candidatus Parabeggiatoa sp.]|nr:hypothetical protein [Candidatus Parabeggiatoa sp.]
MIWFLGFGYFLCYIPYSFLTKATTKGLFSNIEPVSGFLILPASAIATFVCMYLFVTAMGWWKYLEHRPLLGFNLPIPRWQSVISGICTAVIIGTTTLAFSFNGISIIFMLVLMRAGVLIIARVTDAIAHRLVHWYAMIALTLTLLALGVLFLEDGGYAMTLAAGINLAGYLGGYTVRFQVIQRFSKTEDQKARLRYFVEEQMVAMPALVLGLAFFALIGGNDIMLELREGFTTFFAHDALIPALLVGVCYASLYIFGTMIYLDHREYTFCVPVNRASSILSGVVSTFGLAVLFDYGMLPNTYQLGAATLLITALFVLSVSSYREAKKEEQSSDVLQQLFLFVCGGNTFRSPIAQAICHAEIAKHLNIPTEQLAKFGIQVQSAGVSAQVGKPMKAAAEQALSHIEIPVHKHNAQPLTAEMIEQADKIYCMTEAQRQTVLEMLPRAAAKVHCLDPNNDIEEPKGQAKAALDFAKRVQVLIRQRLNEFVINVELATNEASARRHKFPAHQKV